MEPHHKRIAIVHDWLIGYGGAEAVLKEIAALFPDADIYTLIDKTDKRQKSWKWLEGRRIRTSFLQRIPFIRRLYRHLLFLMPYAVERFDLSGYDLVISCSHAVAKGVIIHPGQRHLAYVHTPMRYLWDQTFDYEAQGSFGRGIVKLFSLPLLHRLRLWDSVSSQRLGEIVTICRFTQERIRTCWGKGSAIIHPPVALEQCRYNEAKDAYYVTMSRLAENKRVNRIVEAFREMPERRLIVIGTGPLRHRLEAMAGDNVTFTGFLPTEEAMELLSRARAFLFASKEDFGLVPIEAQACGTPVIAYRYGGVMETVNGLDSPEPTGLFYEGDDSRGVVEAVEAFEALERPIAPAACRRNSERFGVERFRKEFLQAVKERGFLDDEC